MRSTTTVHFLVWLLALIPGVLALPFLGPGLFESSGAWLNALGRLTGIWGLSLLLIAAALCCRVPGFDRPFGGLTKLWPLHHRLGAIAFLMLLAHPLLLTFAAAEVSLEAAMATLFSSRPAIVWGWLALLALMLFMAPSFGFFGEPEYQRWKWLHRLSGVTVVLALVHTGLLSRTFPHWLAWSLWLSFAVLAVSALGYRWFYSRWRGRRPYQVTEVRHPARDVVELTLAAERERLRYRAGQFVYLTPDVNGLEGNREEHPYTLSSAPGEPGLRVAIKDLGNASRALQVLPVGSRVWIEGPYGDFFPDQGQEPELWIAGGIGITPFLGRLREAVHSHQPLKAHLLYCVQDETRLLFGDELATLLAVLPDSRLSVHYFYREGPLTRVFLEHDCPDLLQRAAYICGPIPLLDRARAALVEAGLPARRIVTEEFVLL